MNTQTPHAESGNSPPPPLAQIAAWLTFYAAAPPPAPPPPPSPPLTTDQAAKRVGLTKDRFLREPHKSRYFDARLDRPGAVRYDPAALDALLAAERPRVG